MHAVRALALMASSNVESYVELLGTASAKEAGEVLEASAEALEGGGGALCHLPRDEACVDPCTITDVTIIRHNSTHQQGGHGTIHGICHTMSLLTIVLLFKPRIHCEHHHQHGRPRCCRRLGIEGGTGSGCLWAVFQIVEGDDDT